MRHPCRYDDSDGEVGAVQRAIVRSVAKAVVRYHSWDVLDEIQVQFGPSYYTAIGIATPWVNASVLEMPFPSPAWVTRRMTAKNCPALKMSWGLKVG